MIKILNSIQKESWKLKESKLYCFQKINQAKKKSKRKGESVFNKVEEKESKKRLNETKNKQYDQGKFIERIGEIVLLTKSSYHSSLQIPTNTDPLRSAVEQFLDKIKSPEMIIETIQTLDTKLFSQHNWEALFYKEYIQNLSNSSTQQSKMDLKLIKANQLNRFEQAKLMFQLVDIIVDLQHESYEKVSAIELAKLLKKDDSLISWLILVVKTLVECVKENLNDKSKATLYDILESYIDEWTIYLSNNSKTKSKTYQYLIPKDKLDELRRMIMEPLGLISKQIEARLIVHEPEFQRKKRLQICRTVKIRNSLAFEVHQIKVKLHLTQHLMRNFVSKRSKTDKNIILKKVQECPYEFKLIFEKIEATQLKCSHRVEHIILSEIVSGGKRTDKLEKEIKYKEGSEIIEKDNNFWIVKTIAFPFKFSYCRCKILINGDEQVLLKDLFDLTEGMEYQSEETPRFSFDEKLRFGQHVKLLKLDAFKNKGLGNNYIDNSCYSYQVTPETPQRKAPISIELEGRALYHL